MLVHFVTTLTPFVYHTSLSFYLFWTRLKQLTSHTVFLWLFNIFVPILMGKSEINQHLTPQSNIANNISSKDATGNQSQIENINFIAFKSWAQLASKSVQKLIFSKNRKIG